MPDLAELNIVVTAQGVIEGTSALSNLGVQAGVAQSQTILVTNSYAMLGTQVEVVTGKLGGFSASWLDTHEKMALVNTDVLTAKQSLMDMSEMMELATRRALEHTRTLDALRASAREASKEELLLGQTMQSLQFGSASGVRDDRFEQPAFGPQPLQGAAAAEQVEALTGKVKAADVATTGLRSGVIATTTAFAAMGLMGTNVSNKLILAITNLIVYGMSDLTVGIVAAAAALSVYELAQEKARLRTEQMRKETEEWARSLHLLTQEYQQLNQAVRATDSDPASRIALTDRIAQIKEEQKSLERFIAVKEKEFELEKKKYEGSGERYETPATRDPANSLLMPQKLLDVEEKIRLAKDAQLHNATTLIALESSILPEQERLLAIETRRKEIEDDYTRALQAQNSALKEQKDYAQTLVNLRVQSYDRLTHAQAMLAAAQSPDKHDAGVLSAEADVKSAEYAYGADVLTRGQHPEGSNPNRPVDAADATRARLAQAITDARALLDIARQIADVQRKGDEDKEKQRLADEDKKIKDKAYEKELEDDIKRREQLRSVEQKSLEAGFDKRDRLQKQARDRDFTYLEQVADKQTEIETITTNGYRDEIQLKNLIAVKQRELDSLSGKHFKDQDEIVAKLKDQIEQYETILGFVKEIHAAEEATVSGRRDAVDRKATTVLNQENSGNYAADFQSGYVAQTRRINSNLLTTRELGAAVADTLANDFSNAFDIINQKGKSNSEKMHEWALSLLDDLARLASKQALLSLWGLAMGGDGQAKANNTGPILSGVGAIAGALFGSGGGNGASNPSGEGVGTGSIDYGAWGGGSSAGGPVKRMRKGGSLDDRDITINIVDVRSEDDANATANMMGSDGAEVIVARGSGRPGIHSGTLKAGRR